MAKDKLSKTTIAMVGYFNTLPFLYGLKNADEVFDLILDIPSKCIDHFDNGRAEIALVPIASLLNRNDFSVVSDYCIGCDGAVGTVGLFSDSKISEITKVYLDQDSRTSQLLVKILFDLHWKCPTEFVECDVRALLNKPLALGEAVLMIGDKVFNEKEKTKYIYDLGTEWKNFSMLPFPFAVWIAKPGMDENVIKKLNQSLSEGVNNLDEVLAQNADLNEAIDLRTYFQNYIEYHFDLEKRKSMDLFLELGKKLED